ncbi:multiple sugar transport system ATP-binding protein [Rhodobium orientis]|uniref:Sugar ABC transporter ATP-binding protein n=1 Tax=Rhodobium orientis TaxID=34017 RepID=A0A327JXC0_9HYPH|nr:sn-glycerol-3-phosphate ABC transporter ATP-binding protein UgpC [Rhodobium orientis]MBB4301064.1 multiple sugar transport system ATP-binding protein [Rhodobium orientis]MBK5949732.1 sugar ABC transporter ATP-binding protein [Rhodobium orientis]RAI30153.1 sugar ABC transporter ATP-binding protein [Rhodobium orientis]
MAGVRLKDLSKSFGAVEVLKGIDLTVEPHEFAVLLGPSGCGKSTTLRMLAGLEPATAGEIWIGERNVTNLEPRERDIAMVFQNYALYPHMTIAQNMGFGLKARKLPAAEIAERVKTAAEMLGITDLLGRRPRELSGGQQQRVAIGRAIVREPSLFLFDEPLSNLDAKLRVEMRTELLQLHRSLDATTVYVTHDQEEAMTMADRIVVMNKGRIEQIGSPSEIYFRPASLMVAGFIGSPAMNFVDGTVSDGKVGTPIGAISAPSLPGDGTKVTIGFRPDDFYFPDDLPEEETAATLSFSVRFVELLGARGIVTMRAGDTDFKAIFEERFLHRFEEGATVPLSLARDRLHLFLKETGERVAPDAA